MEFRFNTNYSENELAFLNEHHGEILSKINLSKTDFTEYEIPRRMFRYYGTLVVEIIDDETGDLIWAVLSKHKGVWHVSSCYDSLKSLEQGL